MSYSATISFKRITSIDSVYKFFQKVKSSAIENLNSIAENDYIYCPMCRNFDLKSTDTFESIKYKHDKDDICSKSEYWFNRLFTYRWFYISKWKLLGVYGVSNVLQNLFDGTVYFQNSCDQDYERNDYGGIETFEKIYDEWVLNKTIDEIKAYLNENELLFEFECLDDEALLYARRTCVYNEIWKNLSSTLYNDDDVVYLSLFNYWDSLLYCNKFLSKCVELYKENILNV